MTRRHFLSGAGGTFLMLPLLESLIPRKAFAQISAVQKNFIGVPGIFGEISSYGTRSDLNPRATISSKGIMSGYSQIVLPMHTINTRSLTEALAANGGTQVATLLGPQFNRFLSKILMMQGFSMVSGQRYGHHYHQFGATGDHGDEVGRYEYQSPSINSVMANSRSFYKNPNLLGRSVTTALWSQYTYQQISQKLVNSSDLHGPIKPNDLYERPSVLWDAFFNPFGGPTPSTTTTRPPATTTTTRPPVTTTTRPPVTTTTTQPTSATTTTRPSVTTTTTTTTTTRPSGPTTTTTKPAVNLQTNLIHSVYEEYRSLLSSSKLGKEDKHKIEQHISFINSTNKNVSISQKLQNEYEADMAVTSGVACDNTNPSRKATALNAPLPEVMSAFNDVIASIIACGMCHSFMHGSQTFERSEKSVHDVSHEADCNVGVDGNDAYKTSLATHKSLFDNAILDLMVKLEAVGQLDNSLIAWIPEFGHNNHQNGERPAIIFGDAGGVLKTNQAIDFSDYATNNLAELGFPINQLWATILQAVDVPASEFELYNRQFSGSRVAKFQNLSGFGQTLFAANQGPDEASQAKTHFSRSGWNGYSLSNWLPNTKR